MPNNHLVVSTMENWLWEAACKIRGPVDAPKFKDYSLPLIFLKRLSIAYSDEIAALGFEG
jgi:type I restriction enzyme M protein